MKHPLLVACLFAAATCAAYADEVYPPDGYKRDEPKWCAEGHFLLVNYAKSPGDFTGQSQIWLEYSDPTHKPQHLLTYTNRASPYIDDAGDHIAIQQHEGSADNLLYLFVRGSDGTFHRVPQEMRAAALAEFCRQMHLHKTRDDFSHFDCYPDQWLEHGLLRGYIQGDTAWAGKDFYLKPWYFIYDTEHQKFVVHDFPENKDAFVREQR